MRFIGRPRNEPIIHIQLQDAMVEPLRATICGEL